MVETQTGTTIDVTFTLDGVEHRRSFSAGAGTLRIGRRRDCDLVIDNASISRLHATLDFEAGRWVLRDAGSVNGLKVRGRLVQKHLLSDDRVSLGDVDVHFHVNLPVDLDSEVGHSEQQLSSAIDVDNLDTLLESMLAEDSATKTDHGRAAPSSLGAAEIIQLMRAATDSLLSHDDLDTTLERVLDLVFEHLPANQASVLLFDEENKCLIPRIQRAAPGETAQQIRMSRHIANAAVTSKQAVLVMDAEQDPRFNAAQSIVSLGIRSAMCAPLCHRGRVSGLIYVDRRARNVFTRAHLEVLSILAALSAAAVERARLQTAVEREREIRERLSRYNAPAVIDHIIKVDAAEASGMVAEEREVTVLFADIVGFTSLSEHRTAREVTGLLNEVFQVLTEEVFRLGGTLDKFIGDAVMVFFGAPLPQADHAARAVRVALAMQRRIVELNQQRPADQQRIGLRIGINSGPVVVGDIGALQRKDYTVIGDVVNTANRIESQVAQDGQVVIGPETHALVAGQFECTALPPVQLKGKAQPIQTWLVDRRTPDPAAP